MQNQYFRLQRMLGMEKFTERKGIIIDVKRKLRTARRGFYRRNKNSGSNLHLSRFLTIPEGPPWESVGLSMSQLQIRLFAPDLCSFSAHSYGYALSNEPKFGLKLPNFRFGPDSPTGS